MRLKGDGKVLVWRDVQSLTGRSLVPNEGPARVQPGRRTGDPSTQASSLRHGDDRTAY